MEADHGNGGGRSSFFRNQTFVDKNFKLWFTPLLVSVTRFL